MTWLRVKLLELETWRQIIIGCARLPFSLEFLRLSKDFGGIHLPQPVDGFVELACLAESCVMAPLVGLRRTRLLPFA